MIIPCLRFVSVAAIAAVSACYRLLKSTGELPVDCASTGAFEAAFSAGVRAYAETRRQ